MTELAPITQTPALSPGTPPVDGLTITHTRAAGTLIEGTRKGDGTAEILKANGWRWFRSLGMWGVPQSRDRKCKRWTVDRTADALTAAGYVVAFDIDDTARPAAEVEADRNARQADRVAALEAKADRRHDQSVAAETRMKRAHDALPPWGEPIKIGHHSERRHRRAHEKAHQAWGASVQADRAAAEADRHAEAASHTTAHRENVGVTLRRIQQLEAELRSAERNRDGYRRKLFTNSQTGQDVYDEKTPANGDYRAQLESRIAELADQIAYWRAHVQKQQDNGEIVYDRTMLRKGDYVRYSKFGLWPYPVERVNAKSVTVGTEHGWTQTLPYSTIHGVVNADHEPVTFTNGKRSDGR
ncbi:MULTISPECIES: DUF3560 domain-containing protein [Nocardia]|uniref:DUF3560 domain-containing protein n=1 Tax=Nocardia TaxID=1817 RepID=UPI002458E52A|nr:MULTISPECIES: DUF3560 domain-containing protein [Nocardia]